MTTEGATKGVAIAGVSSPWWLPALHQVSEVAALVLPILGVLWLCIQAVIAIHRFRRGK